MVQVVCVLGVILLLVGAFVGCVPSSQPSSPPLSSSPPSSAPPSSQNLPGPTQSTHPPLNVTIDYIGIKNAYTSVDRYHSNVKIIVAVSDGKTNNEPITIPPAPMTYFETREIKQRVFQTSSVGDYLKVSIMAYNVYNRDDTLNLLSAFEKLGQPVAGSFRAIVKSLPKRIICRIL